MDIHNPNFEECISNSNDPECTTFADEFGASVDLTFMTESVSNNGEECVRFKKGVGDLEGRNCADNNKPICQAECGKFTHGTETLNRHRIDMDFFLCQHWIFHLGIKFAVYFF